MASENQNTYPLRGVRILELGQIIAGTYGSQLLSDLGAEVIKIESPNGDLGRLTSIAPYGSQSGLFLTFNRNKKSMVINLKSEKMSKSLGNIITIDHLLNQFSAAAIRMFFISGNYKNPLEYNADLIAANERAIMRLKNTSQLKSSENTDHLNSSAFIKNFHDAMQSDLNTSMALGTIFELSKAINQANTQNLNIKNAQQDLNNLLNILGININEDQINEKKAHFDKVDEKWIKSQIELRNEYRKSKNFSEADAIRKELLTKGINLLDSKNGTEWTIQ